jgi:nitrite reductase/ring-hydroxylating ferredoxin subunit
MKKTLCTVGDLTEAVSKLVRVSNRLIAVIKVGDEIYALDGHCPHWNALLGSGQVNSERLEIICPLHGFRFSLRDGRCVAAPGRPPVEMYQVIVEGNAVIAEIPETGTAKQNTELA